MRTTKNQNLWNVLIGESAVVLYMLVAMAGPSQRGHVKGGVLQEWRVGSNNLKEDRMLLKTLAMFDTQKRAFLTLLKVRELIDDLCLSVRLSVGHKPDHDNNATQ